MTIAFPKPVRRENGLRKPLRARSPMKRSGPIRRRRPRRLDTAQSEPARLTWVHFCPCEVRRVQVDVGYFAVQTKREAGCRFRIQAAHEGEKKPGMGMKSSDSKSIALCGRHHEEWTEHKGFFAGWSAEQRREWADERGAAAEALYLSAGSRRST